ERRRQLRDAAAVVVDDAAVLDDRRGVVALGSGALTEPGVQREGLPRLDVGAVETAGRGVDVLGTLGVVGQVGREGGDLLLREGLARLFGGEVRGRDLGVEGDGALLRTAVL